MDVIDYNGEGHMFDGAAWLKGNAVDGARFQYNQQVRIVTGEHVDKLAWVVSIDVSERSGPVYTVELCGGDEDQVPSESAIEPAA